MFSNKNFNSSESFYTWRNANFQIALIPFWAYTKRAKILFKYFLFANRSTVISPHFWQLLRNTGIWKQKNAFKPPCGLGCCPF